MVPSPRLLADRSSKGFDRRWPARWRALDTVLPTVLEEVVNGQSVQSPMFDEVTMRRLTRAPKITGNADRPGTGPKGETCRTCKHIEGPPGYTKACGLMRSLWEFRTQKQNDIRLKDRACGKWERTP